MRLFVPIVIIMGASLSGCSGDRIPEEYRDIGIPEDRLVSMEAVEHGRFLFQQHCAVCHGRQLNGRGPDPDFQAADLTSEEWLSGTSPRWMFYIIREGKSHSRMLGLKDKLTEMETWDIVGYVIAEGTGDYERE